MKCTDHSRNFACRPPAHLSHCLAAIRLAESLLPSTRLLLRQDCDDSAGESESAWWKYFGPAAQRTHGWYVDQCKIQYINVKYSIRSIWLKSVSTLKVNDGDKQSRSAFADNRAGSGPGFDGKKKLLQKSSSNFILI